MKRILVKDLHNVSILSQAQGWEVIYDKLIGLGLLDGKDEILLDFKGISVMEPYKHEFFKVLLGNDKVNMKFYNIEDTVQQIKVMCIVDGYRQERIQNEGTVVVEKVKSSERLIINTANALVGITNLAEDGVLYVSMCDMYSQMSNGTTIMALEYMIEGMLKEGKNIKDIIIKLGKITIQSRVVEMMVDLKFAMNKKHHIDVAFDVDNESVIEQLNLYMHKKESGIYTVDKKVELLKELGAKTVGVLIKYKKSKGLDEFGRHGKGEVVSSRVALLQGTGVKESVEGEKIEFARFTTFSSNTLYTKNHWAIEHDGEVLEMLEGHVVEVPIKDLGITNKVIGSQYHFALPIQEREEDTIEMYNVDENGRVYDEKMTLPERIKAVFEDFNIQYNKKSLEEAISRTKMILEEEQ